MLDLLIELTTWLAALLGFNLLLALMPRWSKQLGRRERLYLLALSLAFAATALGAWRLRAGGDVAAAWCLLGCLYLPIGVVTLTAAGKARWN